MLSRTLPSRPIVVCIRFPRRVPFFPRRLPDFIPRLESPSYDPRRSLSQRRLWQLNVAGVSVILEGVPTLPEKVGQEEYPSESKGHHNHRPLPMTLVCQKSARSLFTCLVSAVVPLNLNNHTRPRQPPERLS